MTVLGAAYAIEFYKKAFGAEELGRMPMPDGRLVHAEIRIGDSVVMLSDEFPEWGGKGGPLSLGGTAVGLHLYFEDVNSAWQRAIDAGAKVTMPLADAFWGDRYGKLVDPFGHEWSMAQHVEDVSLEEMTKRMQASFGPKS